MHTYEQRWSDDPARRTLPKLGDFRFTGPLDVVAYAELDPVLKWRNSPEVWHLDSNGRFRCGSQGSSFDSVRTFADDLDGLLALPPDRARLAVPEQVADPRVPSPVARALPGRRGRRAGVPGPPPRLVGYGITLVDVMVFDQEFHWWSLHELTTGSWSWR